MSGPTPEEIRYFEERIKEVPLLHIYGQHAFHDEAYIAGNRNGLTSLRDALNLALEAEHHCASVEVIQSDGEGYRFIAYCEEGGSEMRRLARSYTEDFARESSSDALWPWDVASVMEQVAAPSPDIPMRITRQGATEPEEADNGIA